MSSRSRDDSIVDASPDPGHAELWPAEEIDHLLLSARSPSRKVSCPAQTVPPNSPSVRTHQLSPLSHAHTAAD